MKKILLTGLVMAITVIPALGFCQSKLDEAKQKLIGSWKFGHLYSLRNDNPGEVDDACIKSVVYHFKDDGTVFIENTDKPACQYGNRTMNWMMVVMHDDRGKEHFAVRICEEGIGERASYDGNTFTDEIYMLVSFKKKFFTWIPKPQYKVPSTNNDMQYYYSRSD